MQDIISNFESISEKDMNKYAGRWIAVIDGRIVAYADSFKEVYDYAKKNYPSQRPLFGKLPSRNFVSLSLS